jgi:hypothetical protein
VGGFMVIPTVKSDVCPQDQEMLEINLFVEIRKDDDLYKAFNSNK